MINPIQQNVVFKGIKKNDAQDNFKGAPNVTSTNLSVREGYLNAVKDVNDTRTKMTDLNSGKKFDIIV